MRTLLTCIFIREVHKFWSCEMEMYPLFLTFLKISFLPPSLPSFLPSPPLSLSPSFFLSFLREWGGREKESKRDIDVHEKHGSVGSHTPQMGGTWPATQACALARNWTSNRSFGILTLNPQSYSIQGSSLFLTSTSSSMPLTWWLYRVFVCWTSSE